jgi:CRISPR-associated endonuclease/helicase Cas3
MESYSEFFFRITGKKPFPYQVRFHEEPAEATIVSVPTGLGKTDAVIVDWLYRRPTKRLVYCLPGRALTRQVAKVARERAREAGQKLSVLELMGGSTDNELTLSPSEPAILVGTQDILVSRALNRGYARSPFRWPIDFALLNNDVTWVYDEVQLLGDALATSTQMAAFRSKFGTFGGAPSIWMSATFDRKWLDTVDFCGTDVSFVELQSDDLKMEEVQKRLHAEKSISAVPAECRSPSGCAAFVKQNHRPGSLTLVVTNTVLRAREIWAELSDLDPLLLHSRFRPADRAVKMDRLLNNRAGIVVSTQVIEAGIDIDADLLITDVAPWPSLVQRFGRVNRYGEKPGCRIFWIDRPLTSKSKALSGADELKPKDWEQVFAPYEPDAVESAIKTLQPLRSGAPAGLPGTEEPPPYKFVLRRADLLDLFDTTPDLAGNQIDVSRFVRSGNETDVYVAWREWVMERAPERTDLRRINDDELCPVPFGKDIQALISKHGAWIWRYTGRGQWEKVDAKQLYPGMRMVLRTTAGGYDPKSGWSPDGKKPVQEIDASNGGLACEEAASDDPNSDGYRQSLVEHTDEVVHELNRVLEGLVDIALNGYQETLNTAARHHDWGKAHPVFQQTLHNLTDPPKTPPDELLAKQRRGESSRGGHSRDWFRHELASALAMLQAGCPDLAAYIVAAHHGKVRVNIRSMPGEVSRNNDNPRTARGIREGDYLFPAHLGNGYEVSQSELTLGQTEIGIGADGAPAWSDRVIRLIDELGPFRLVFLEMLLRVSDENASARKRESE